MIEDFEWDAAKAEVNERKHGVTFEEALTVFFDPLALIIDDPLHSEEEERWILFGRSDHGRFLAVMFTERGEVIRLISARQMSPRERRAYEQRAR